MTTSRLIAIGFICFVSGIAWFILGTSVTGRSGAFDSQLTSEVSRLWEEFSARLPRRSP